MQEFCSRCKEPITEATMINTSLIHVIATRLMKTVYHEWKQLNDGDKMWSKFKEHFSNAFNELQELNEITAGGARFWTNTIEFTPMAINKISSALDNLANAIVQKKHAVDKLAGALKTATDETSWLNKIIKSLSTDSKRNDKPQKDWDSKGYYLIHGYKVERDHSSKTCKNKHKGHNDETTREILWANPFGIGTGNPRWLDGAY